MIEAKPREANELHRFECIGLGQERVEKSTKGIIGLCLWKENGDRDIGLGKKTEIETSA
jgi:hypothetical protein